MPSATPASAGSSRGWSRFSVKLVEHAEAPPTLPAGRIGPQEAARFLHPLVAELPAEACGALLLNAYAAPIGYTIPYFGTLAGASVEPRGLLQPALLANAASLVVFHNHPQGGLQPSHADLDFTRRMLKAGEIVGVPMIDHLILGEPPRFTSILDHLRMLDRMKLGATATDPAQPVDRRKHVRPKYRHPDTGQTWAGRGSRPLWLRAELERGADLKDFRIPSETT